MYKQVVYNGKIYDYLEINEYGDMKNTITGWTYNWYKTARGYNYTLVTVEKYKKKRFLQHRVVAGTFIPNILNKPHINHIDGNKINNHISNLEWCTARENNKHAWKMGLTKCHSGEERGVAKLTREQVIYIVENYKARSREWGAKSLAKKLNVPYSVVNSVASGQSWIKFIKEYQDEKLQIQKFCH